MKPTLNQVVHQSRIRLDRNTVEAFAKAITSHGKVVVIDMSLKRLPGAVYGIELYARTASGRFLARYWHRLK